MRGCRTIVGREPRAHFDKGAPVSSVSLVSSISSCILILPSACPCNECLDDRKRYIVRQGGVEESESRAGELNAEKELQRGLHWGTFPVNSGSGPGGLFRSQTKPNTTFSLELAFR